MVVFDWEGKRRRETRRLYICGIICRARLPNLTAFGLSSECQKQLVARIFYIKYNSCFG